MRWPIASQKELLDLGAEIGLGSDYIRIGGVKGFMDGSLGSSTAKMFEPYLNEPNSTGIYIRPRGKLGFAGTGRSVSGRRSRTWDC